MKYDELWEWIQRASWHEMSKLEAELIEEHVLHYLFKRPEILALTKKTTGVEEIKSK